MMARAKRIYILMIKVNELVQRFLSRGISLPLIITSYIFEIENMFSVFLSSQRN